MSEEKTHPACKRLYELLQSPPDNTKDYERFMAKVVLENERCKGTYTADQQPTKPNQNRLFTDKVDTPILQENTRYDDLYIAPVFFGSHI